MGNITLKQFRVFSNAPRQVETPILQEIFFHAIPLPIFFFRLSIGTINIHFGINLISIV